MHFCKLQFLIIFQFQFTLQIIYSIVTQILMRWALSLFISVFIMELGKSQ